MALQGEGDSLTAFGPPAGPNAVYRPSNQAFHNGTAVA